MRFDTVLIEDKPEAVEQLDLSARITDPNKHILDLRIGSVHIAEIASLIQIELRSNKGVKLEHPPGNYSRVSILAESGLLDSGVAVKMIGGRDWLEPKDKSGFPDSPIDSLFLQPDYNFLRIAQSKNLLYVPDLLISFFDKDDNLVALVMREVEGAINSSLENLMLKPEFDCKAAQDQICELLSYFLIKGVMVFDTRSSNYVKIHEGQWMNIDAGAMVHFEQTEDPDSRCKDLNNVLSDLMRKNFSPLFTLDDLLNTVFFDNIEEIKPALRTLAQTCIKEGRPITNPDLSKIICISPDKFLVGDGRILCAEDLVEDPKFYDPNHIVELWLKGQS